MLNNPIVQIKKTSLKKQGFLFFRICYLFLDKMFGNSCITINYFN